MAVQHHVRNPMEWGWDRLKETGQAIGSAASTMDGAWEAREMAPPVVRKIGLEDLRQALREGARDFGACRTDVVFLCMIYPIAGLIISRFAFDYGMLPLIFPLVSGFALIAPLFGVGLYEMSRRRELGTATGWADAFAVVRSPAIGSVMALGLVLIGLFALWLAAANFIYTVTLGPDQKLLGIELTSYPLENMWRNLVAANVEHILGGRGNDTLIGNGGNDVLYSDPGGDNLNAGAGEDLLVSSVPTCQGHTYDGGAGEDTVSYARSNDNLRVVLGGSGGPAGCGNDDRVLGVNESLEGSDGPDVLIGDNGDNSLMGHVGADVFIAKGGNDFIEAADGQRDKQIDCGGGGGDDVVKDGSDPTSGCN